MMISFDTIPRFGLPYTFADFATALAGLLGECHPAEQFVLFHDSPKFWTCSGRQALWLLLRGLELRPGAGVAIPLFTDLSVVSAVAAAGYQPVFVDVDLETMTMDPKSLAAAQGKFSAVVIVHLFGHVADVRALLAVAGTAPVIEDTAHAPFSYADGRMVGGFGKACFYSFASTKYWPAGGGGLAVVHDTRLAVNVAAAVSSLPPPSRFGACRNLLLQAAKAAVFSRWLYGLLGRPSRRWAERWALLEPSLNLVGIQPAHAAVASRQALQLERRVELQRQNSLRLLAQLSKAEDIVLPRERSGTRYNYHLFPVLLRDEKERQSVTRAMLARGVDTSQIYYNIVDHCRKFGYQGGCPVGESVAARLITLPNHAALPGKHIDRVAQAFLFALEDWRSAHADGWLSRVVAQKSCWDPYANR